VKGIEDLLSSYKNTSRTDGTRSILRRRETSHCRRFQAMFKPDVGLPSASARREQGTSPSNKMSWRMSSRHKFNRGVTGGLFCVFQPKLVRG
jgi:hypothetical protein